MAGLPGTTILKMGTMTRLTSLCCAALGAAVWLCMTPTASRASVSFTGTDGTRVATAAFSSSGNDLIIVLTNPAMSDAMKQIDILSALFFDLDTPGPLTLQSAVASGALGVYQQNSTANSVANGSLTSFSVPNLAAPGSTNGGPGAFQGGWQFREDMGGLSGVSQTRGLGTNGLGVFNGGEVKLTDNLDFGLTSAGDDETTSQAKQLFNMPLVQDSITFTLSGLPTGFVLDETTVSNVRFQYGTSLSEPSTTGELPPPDVQIESAPEMPSSAAWACLAGLGLAYAAWRRQGLQAAA